MIDARAVRRLGDIPEVDQRRARPVRGDRIDDAEHAAGEALDIGTQGALPYSSRTQLDLAELAIARGGPGDADGASDLLGTVQRAVDQYGYAGLQRRIDKLRDRT